MSILKDYYKLQNQENYIQNPSIILNIHKYQKLQYKHLQKSNYQIYTNLSQNRGLNLNREIIYI